MSRYMMRMSALAVDYEPWPCGGGIEECANIGSAIFNDKTIWPNCTNYGDLIMDNVLHDI